jgi:hypothetical protein
MAITNESSGARHVCFYAEADFHTRSVLMLSSHPRLGIPSGLLLSGSVRRHRKTICSKREELGERFVT